MFREGVYRIRGRNKGDDRGRVIVERVMTRVERGRRVMAREGDHGEGGGC